MPNFESPLGNKKFSAPALKELEIPDESEYYQPMPPVDRQQMNEMARRRTMSPNMQVMDEDAIRDFQNKMSGSSQENTGEIEREIRAAREARRTGKERLSEGAKRRIEILLNMVRATREVEVAGNTFVLQTLSAKDERTSLLTASEFSGTVEFLYELRRQHLARSLCQISGVEVSQFLGSDALEAKLTLIDELDETLCIALYGEYTKLLEETKSKYGIKTAAEVKGVAEDLKK